MAKTSGLGARLFIGGFDLSGDTGAVQRIAGGCAPIDVTGIDKSAMERIGGQRDGGIEWSSFFNPTGAHPVLSALPTADVLATYCHGTTLGNPAACCIGKQIDYAPTRANDGALTMAVAVQASGFGLEWGVQATAGQRTDTTATAGTAFDAAGGATTNFGVQAYLQVFSFTGTSVTVKLQESSDNAGDAYVDVVGGGFVAATAVGTQRIATATNLAVERFLKVTTTGTFTEATFHVVVVRNLAAPAF